LTFAFDVKMAIAWRPQVLNLVLFYL